MVAVVERHQTGQRHRRTTDVTLAGRRAGATRRALGAGSARIVAVHVAGEALADLRRARAELAGGRRLPVADVPAILRMVSACGCSRWIQCPRGRRNALARMAESDVDAGYRGLRAEIGRHAGARIHAWHSE